MAAQDDATKYSLGSVLNHVLMHQTIVGMKQSCKWKWPMIIRIY
ncbi:MAG: hypothetical protein CM1200mP5_4320 [Candidatus Pelagibacterales bacterium]|nr:MAG: hypothetical protein CM1200mP5_4320 [Pelagibacterales bacterium]